MSTIITIKNNKRVGAKTAISEVLNDKRVKLYEHPFSQQPINYDYCKLYIKKESTRGILVETQKHEITIRVNIMSSEADLNLAVNTVKTLCKLCESQVWVENDPNPIQYKDVDNGDLKKTLFENQVAGATMVKHFITNEEEVQIDGLFSSFFPNKELVSEDYPVKLHNKLIERFLELQNLDGKGIRITNPITRVEDGKRTTYIALTAGHSQLIAKCDRVVLADVRNEYYMAIPMDKFFENLGCECEMVDCVQAIFPAIEREEFNALMSRMREFEVPLT